MHAKPVATLQLHNIGELVVARLLERLTDTSRVKCKWRDQRRPLSDFLGAQPTCETDVRLCELTGGEKGVWMDGLHRIDVVARDAHGSVVAVEVKVGTALTKEEFVRRAFVSPRQTKHSPPRIGGTIPGILATHATGGPWPEPADPQQALHVMSHDSKRTKLASDWLLVARERRVAELNDSSVPEPGHPWLLALEDLIDASVGIDGFNGLVGDLLAEPRDFVAAWKIERSRGQTRGPVA